MNIGDLGRALDTGYTLFTRRTDKLCWIEHEHRTVSVSNVRQAGAGKRVFVLGHGFGTDQTAWHKVLPTVTARGTAILYDLPGAGPDGPATWEPDRHRSLHAFADDVAAMLDAEDVERCTYIGHPVSCMIGVIAAIAEPDRFEKLILIGGSPRYLDDGDYRGGFTQPQLDTIYDSMATNYEAWIAGFAPLAVGDAGGRAPVAEFARSLDAIRPDIALATARTIFQSDLRGIVGALDVPAVILQPRADMAVPIEVGHWLRQRWSGSTLDILETSGHLPHLSTPDLVTARLEAHL